MTSPPIISTRGLSRHFRGPGGTGVVAVADLTMDVEPGSLTAFLGPNGAGKSTSLRMLTTLLEPTAGHATVCGHDIATEPAEVRARIGYIGQKNGAGQYYRLRDELVSQGAFYGLGRVERRRRADELIEILDLGELANRPTLTLSGGQRRRIDIALGLVPGPRLLFLDEPSTGLDPQSRANLWDHILSLRDRYEMTLFLTTHYLDEADRFAERVMVVDHGRIIADDTAVRLKSAHAGSHERMLVAPVARSALMVGRALKEMVPLTVQALVITGVAAIFGFRPSLLMALGLVLLAVFGVGLGALSYALGIACRERDWMFWTVQQGLLFPLMILSGMLLPLEAAPTWMQVLSRLNPLTYLVDAERALFGGALTDPAVWQGAVAAAVIAALGLAVGIRAMRRSI